MECRLEQEELIPDVMELIISQGELDDRTIIRGRDSLCHVGAVTGFKIRVHG